MTTSQLLAGITDRGQFERLATAILREADPDCAGIIHAGINDAGETVVAPIDGFRVVTDVTPPKLIFVAHTTTDRSKLRSKLLSGDEADLKKVTAKLTKWRATLSGATAKVVLCVNEPMGRQEDLYRDVAAEAVAIKAELEVWDRTRLAAFLDDDARGQWIRQAYFGIAAQRPSPGLLHALGRQSIAALREEMGPFAATLVDRGIDLALGSLPTPKLTWLVGPSGFGKTTAALRYAQSILNSGRLAFYLPAEGVRRGWRLVEVLEHHLRSLHADFAPGVGAAALELASEVLPITLIIEDINRIDGGEQLGMRIAAWVAPKVAGDAGRPTPPVHLIVPVWPELWQANAASWGRQAGARTIEVDALAPDEGGAAVRSIARVHGLELSAPESEGLADLLGRDPFLIGRFGELIEDKHSTAQLMEIARRDVMQAFLQRQAMRLARMHTRPADDYLDALVAVADRMLRERRLQPTIQEVRDWLGHGCQGWQAINELLENGSLCRRRIGADGREHMVMRHDRLQSALLAASATKLLRDVAGNAEVLREPFYAGIVGQAIAGDAVAEKALPMLVDLNPVAVFEALRLIGEPRTLYQTAIATTCLHWAENASQRSSNAVVWAASLSLALCDSVAARRAAQYLRPNRVLLLARFRNGDAAAGAGYLQHPPGELYPAVGDEQFERVLQHVRLRHASTVAAETLNLIDRAKSIDTARGALALAGYLQLDGIWSVLPSIMSRSALNQEELLPHLLWVAMRCAPDMLRDGPMRLLDRLLSLPTSDGKGWNAQWHTCRELGWAGRHGYPSAAIAAVIAWADGLTRRRALDAEILSAVDDSDAVEFVARVAAESSDGLFGGTTAISTSDLERRALSPAAMLRLRDLWQSGFENDRVRRVAFGTWLTGAGWELRDVVVAACGDENLRDLAIQWRVKSGDESAAPLLIDQAQRQPFWWRLARHIWSPSVRTAVERAIVAMSDGDGDTASDLSELLYDIPSPDAESIVTRHQAIVRTSAAFVRAAAVVNTPRLRQFVAEAIASWEGSRDPFEFLGLALRAQQRKGTLSQSAFGALEPYLDRLSERALGSVGFAADDAGEMSWAERQIWSRIARPGAYVSGESGFLRELDDVHTNKDRFLSFDHVCDRYLRGGLLAPRLLELAFDWLRSHLDERGVALVAQVVTHLGGRDDVAELSVAARPLVSVGAVVRVLDNTKYQVERATLARNAQDRAMR